MEQLKIYKTNSNTKNEVIHYDGGLITYMQNPWKINHHYVKKRQGKRL